MVVVVVKFTEKPDKNHESDNETHTHTPQIYTQMFGTIVIVVVVCAGLVACLPHGCILNTNFFFMHV